jgi:crossover junction endodeoxyribonuclease RuvC
MRFLGVDPGFSRTGYGLIEKRGDKLLLISAGVIEIKASNFQQKLLQLAGRFEKLLKKARPDVVAIEKIYFKKNAKTAIEVAQARGVLLLMIIKNKKPVLEYSPSEIKRLVALHGSADKKAVAKMVALILGQPKLPVIDDATDALAIAISAAYH